MGKYVSIGVLNTASDLARKSSGTVKQLEDREDWVSGDKEVLKRINDLFQNWDNVVSTSDRGRDNIIKVMAMVNTGNMLNLVNFLKKKDDSYLFNQLLTELNKCETEYSRIIIKRFLTLYRVSVIPRVFSMERLDAIHEQIKKNNFNK